MLVSATQVAAAREEAQAEVAAAAGAQVAEARAEAAQAAEALRANEAELRRCQRSSLEAERRARERELARDCAQSESLLVLVTLFTNSKRRPLSSKRRESGRAPFACVSVLDAAREEVAVVRAKLAAMLRAANHVEALAGKNPKEDSWWQQVRAEQDNTFVVSYVTEMYSLFPPILNLSRGYHHVISYRGLERVWKGARRARRLRCRVGGDTQVDDC
eukprot:632731-Prorocentrum_minimum.AAC.1